eukprot:SAG11_NODE_16_length_26235_cov_39.900417_18_plen_54_part_00
MNLDRPVEPDDSAFCTNIAQGPEISLEIHLLWLEIHRELTIKLLKLLTGTEES